MNHSGNKTPSTCSVFIKCRSMKGRVKPDSRKWRNNHSGDEEEHRQKTTAAERMMRSDRHPEEGNSRTSALNFALIVSINHQDVELKVRLKAVQLLRRFKAKQASLVTTAVCSCRRTHGSSAGTDLTLSYVEERKTALV